MCCYVIKWSLIFSDVISVNKMIYYVFLITHTCFFNCFFLQLVHWLHTLLMIFPFWSNLGSFSGCPICPSLVDWTVPRCWRWHHHAVGWKTEEAMKPGHGVLTLFLQDNANNCLGRSATHNQVSMGLVFLREIKNSSAENSASASSRVSVSTLLYTGTLNWPGSTQQLYWAKH